MIQNKSPQIKKIIILIFGLLKLAQNLRKYPALSEEKLVKMLKNMPVKTTLHVYKLKL